jgi:phage replication-related protein YjqB (UPF0714/DUF867 family)
MDSYQSFTELKQHEVDYSLELCDRDSPVTILAPHGGNIEPHTSDIAKLIAADTYNYFCFNGQKSGSNRDLHITSHRYDEEQAVSLVQKSRTVIAVHGCTSLELMVYLGGLDSGLLEKISESLADRNIPCSSSGERYAGRHMGNICNRGSTGRGVQLEISRPLRDDPEAWKSIAACIRYAISTL